MSKKRYTMTTKLQHLLFDYQGKWVACTFKHLIAFGDDPTTVLAEARAKGYKSPILYRVPEAGTSHYYAEYDMVWVATTLEWVPIKTASGTAPPSRG